MYQEKAVGATKMFMEHEGIEILDEIGDDIIVSIVDNTVVFTEVVVNRPYTTEEAVNLPPELQGDKKLERRGELESIAIKWLFEREYGGMLVRFDTATVTMLDDDRGLLRYHTNSYRCD